MNGFSSAAFPDAVLFLDIISLVDRAAIDFGPGVGLERHFLRAQDHLRGYAVMAQHGSDDRRALQTEHALWIPDAGAVDRVADAADCIGSRQPGRNFPTADESMHLGEVAAEPQNIKGQQGNQSSPGQETHTVMSPRTPSSWQMKASLSVTASMRRFNGCTAMLPHLGL